MTCLRVCSLLLTLYLLAVHVEAQSQELVITPTHDFDFVGGDGDPVVIIGDLKSNLSNPALTYVAPPTIGTSSALKPHGLTMVSANQALVTHFAVQHGGLYLGAIDIIDTVNARRTDTIEIPDYQTDGLGTVAINPAKNTALVFSGYSNNTLFVISGPFTSTSTVTEVTMPSNGGSAQTHAVVFDDNGRAYVGHGAGISALDPPYTSIAFTISVAPFVAQIRGRAVALSHDGSIMATTVDNDALVQILHAPFSASSTSTTISVPNARALNALSFTPDDSQLLITDDRAASDGPKVFAIGAPYSVAATIETLAAGSAEVTSAFEDIDISADGNFAALSGGTETSDPIVILQAPFTAQGVRVHPLPIPPIGNGSDGYAEIGGRGAGTARFWSQAIPTMPQINPDGPMSFAEGDAGTSPMRVPIRLTRPSTHVVTVDYATSDHDLTAPSRYLATSGTLTFMPGEVYKTVAIPIVGNTIADGSGQFFLDLSNPTNATLIEAKARIVCSVIDNDNTIIVATNPPLADAIVGAPYSITFAASGSASGFDNWSAVNGLFEESAIPGLSMNPDTGELSGIPTTTGEYYFLVSATTKTDQPISTGYRGYQLKVGSDRIFADDFETN